MSEADTNQEKRTAARRYTTLMRYGGAALAVWLALSLWSLLPVFHQHSFALFLAAVLLTARFIGFGPALFCSVLSTACLDLFVIVPRFSFSLSSADLQSLAAFFALSVFAGSMARQKSQAEVRAEKTTREMAAIVEYSDDAILSISPDGTITSWNRGAERLYGYSAQEAVGASVYQLAPPERREEVDRIMRVLNRGGRVEPYQTCLLYTSPSPRDGLLSRMPSSA